jgi:16S rRNA (guanine(966)-N(2))-methyltransferase RsmD
VRIISGQFKGRKLFPANLKFTRPTTDFAREGLFNILHSRLDFDGMQILDLYSGSGAIAFEFVSRGVQSVIAVDKQVESVKFIAGIKNKWEIENLETIKSDVLRYLSKCHTKFDLIFADPPYQSEDHMEIIKLAFENEMLNDEGYLVLEHEKRKNFESVSGFEFQRSFGNVNFSIFRQSN